MSKMDTLAADISNEIDEKCADTLMRANSHTDSIAKKHRDKIAKIKVLPTLAPKVLKLFASLLCLASFKKAFTWFSGILVTDVFVFFVIKRSHFLLDIAENLEK